MRGGLGRILLTAFMLLAIVPLSIVSYLAIQRVQRDMRQAKVDNLARLAVSTAAQLQSWLDVQQYGLTLLAEDTELEQAIRSGNWMRACSVLQNHSLDHVELALSVSGTDKHPVAMRSAVREAERPPHLRDVPCALDGEAEVTASQMLSLTVPVRDKNGCLMAELVGYPHINGIVKTNRVIGQGIYVAETHESVSAFLIDADGRRWSLSLASDLSSDTTGNLRLPEGAAHLWSIDISPEMDNGTSAAPSG